MGACKWSAAGDRTEQMSKRTSPVVATLGGRRVKWILTEFGRQSWARNNRHAAQTLVNSFFFIWQCFKEERTLWFSSKFFLNNYEFVIYVLLYHYLDIFLRSINISLRKYLTIFHIKHKIPEKVVNHNNILKTQIQFWQTWNGWFYFLRLLLPQNSINSTKMFIKNLTSWICSNNDCYSIYFFSARNCQQFWN